MAGDRGSQYHRYPLDPCMQARICRQFAKDMRAEHAAGMPPIKMRDFAPPLPRDEAARRMDARAARWEAEIATGIPNHQDRRSMGFL